MEDLRAGWADATERADIIDRLADPFDLLCHLAFNAPVLTRRQRADRVKGQHVAFFTFYAPEVRENLNDLLEKYAADGEFQFTLPDVLKVPPISQRGSVGEIVTTFGGETANPTLRQMSASPLSFSLQPLTFPPVPPISERGNVNEIMTRFGGATNLSSAVNQLQSLLYAA